MEPNRTRQVIQDLARAFNKLASELTADLTYAAREIESLHREVQRLRSSPGKTGRPSTSSKKSSHASKTGGSSRRSNKPTHAGMSDEPSKPAHEPGAFVFPQEPFSPSHPPEPTAPGNN